MSKHLEACSKNEITTRRIWQIDSLQTVITNLHRDEEKTSSRRRLQQIDRDNRRANVQTQTFEVGDVVLVRRANTMCHKLRFH